MGMPATRPFSADYNQHLQYDGVGLNPAAAGFAQGGDVGVAGFGENLRGHTSGVGTATPWSTPAVRPTITPYGDAGGAGSVYAATTLTDAVKTWGVADKNIGATVTYAAGTITDSARNNAGAWVVANTAQYAGLLIITDTGKYQFIASAALGVLTLAGNWIGGTPAAGEGYRINPTNGFVGRTIIGTGTGNARTLGVILYHIGTVATIAAWSNGTPANGSIYTIGLTDQPAPHYPNRVGGEVADNWYKASTEDGNIQAA